MCTTFRTISLMFILIVLVLSSVLPTNAFETYSETDQLAEESLGGYDKEGPHECCEKCQRRSGSMKGVNSVKGHSVKDNCLHNCITCAQLSINCIKMERNLDNTADKTQSTTNTNLISPIKESLVADEDQSVKEISVEDDQFDPLQKILPKVKFNCKGKSEGYYADNEFCQVFHYCKTNGFRFTFMCPPESYYNDKLMACEFNSTLSKCVDNNRETYNETQNKISKTVKQTSIKPSAGQTFELLEKSSSQINSNTEKSKTITTTTTESTKAYADPYLTRRRTPFGWRPNISDKNKEQNTSTQQYISPKTRSQNQTTLSENNENITQTILPFNGFRKSNRNKILKNNKNNTQSVENSFKNTQNMSHPKESSLRIPLNALPVLNSIRANNKLSQHSNQERITETIKNYRNKGSIKTAATSTTTTLGTTTTTTTTTTPHPSLLGPTAQELMTSSPFDFFTPIFNSGSNFPMSSDFFPLSMHKRPENSENSNKRNSVMTQNFYNSIRHTTGRPHIEKESQIEETLKQSETNSQFSQINQSSHSSHSTHLPSNKFNRSPLLDNENQDQIAMADESHLSETQIQELIEKLKRMESNERINYDFQKSDSSEGQSLIQPNETIESIDESAHIGRGKRKTKRKFLTVPLLVPTGISKSDLRRKLSTSLLKPTVLPLTESGEEMPAYVLQFQKSERSGKAKHNKQRSKRQIFNWNPFQSNPFLSNSHSSQHSSYYLPMNSIQSPVYSHFHNNRIQNTHPINTYSPRNWNLGERHGFTLPSAQQHIPYYIPPKQPFIPNNFISNDLFRDNVYDLSEFSDFYENPRHVPIVAQDMSPYRSVSLKKPGFKRPPRRHKIPDTNKLNASQTINETKTTVRPSYSMPVSPRPYSQPVMDPIVKQQYYTRNTNPFSDFSDDSLSEAIKVFDNSDDNLQPLDPDFDSQPLFNFNSGRSFSNDFIPMTPKAPSFAETLNGRSSRLNTFSEIPINYGSNSYIADNFPPLPNFGDPSYRIPFIDIPDPSHSNLGNRHNYDRNSNKDFVQRKSDNNTRYSTPYLPEIIFNTNPEIQNQTERNPNHNYDNVEKADLQSARTVDIKQNTAPILKSTLNWDNIVGQYHKQNLSLTKVSPNKNDSKDQKESEISKNQRYISYGTRLSGNTNRYSQNPEVSVKTSVSSISSLEPEASNQIIISKKLGTSALSSVNDIKEKSIDELYNQRAFDRLMLFNYYNRLNSQKDKTSTTTTTTVNPLEGKYPSTSHWSIRGWTGQYYPQYSTKTSIGTTTPVPVITAHSNIEYIDLFESETKNSETTTDSSETTTTVKPEPPYKKVFNSQMGATFHSTKYSRPYSSSHKTRSDISNYLSSLTSTTTSTLKTI